MTYTDKHEDVGIKNIEYESKNNNMRIKTDSDFNYFFYIFTFTQVTQSIPSIH